MKADAEQALNEQKGTVKSIIEIAKGIQEGDWAKVIYFGGKEFAKVVLTVMVEIVCPPCALIAGPVVAALVDLYGGLAEDVFKMVTSGDFGKLPEIMFEFYFSEMIARPCALLPDGGFKDAICGNLAKVIAAAAGVFGDAVDFIARRGRKRPEGGRHLAGRRRDRRLHRRHASTICSATAWRIRRSAGRAERFSRTTTCRASEPRPARARPRVPMTLHAACMANFKPCYRERPDRSATGSTRR